MKNTIKYFDSVIILPFRTVFNLFNKRINWNFKAVFWFIFRETMSFNKYKEIIEENDLVMLYIDFSTIIPIKVTEWTTSKKGNEIENICQTKYGALKVSDLIGKKFGCRVNLMSANGFAHALHPTPELWTKALPHRNE